MTAPELPNYYSTSVPIPSGLREAIPSGETPGGPAEPKKAAFGVVEYYPEGSLTKVKPLRPKAHLSIGAYWDAIGECRDLPSDGDAHNGSMDKLQATVAGAQARRWTSMGGQRGGVRGWRAAVDGVTKEGEAPAPKRGTSAQRNTCPYRNSGVIEGRRTAASNYPLRYARREGRGRVSLMSPHLAARPPPLGSGA